MDAISVLLSMRLSKTGVCAWRPRDSVTPRKVAPARRIAQANVL